MYARGLNALGGLITCMQLADRIREAMGGMTPSELARAAKVTPASVTFWLDGTTKSLKAETAALIEAATGYRASWIVTGKGPKRIEDQASSDWPFLSVTRDEVERLTPEQRGYVEGKLAAAIEQAVSREWSHRVLANAKHDLEIRQSPKRRRDAG